eukprot:CAMPEP_0194129802 /NCGR_PEP_ID=MMETSP0152-20130528/1010_1 /TAXON_ID=1049557 /ORGANISM="Thalassiothrix antarctica, Strain L6-D1" /LENGTH=185 /DNA_ID=CAMNT_0038824139 /DNA_START=32 /DNA_END=589 /DNA_ORIENTATION=+
MNLQRQEQAHHYQNRNNSSSHETIEETKSLNLSLAMERQEYLRFGRPQSKPIDFSFTRTNSEIQLYQDEQYAEYQDFCMYIRIMGGAKGSRNLPKGTFMEGCHSIIQQERYNMESEPEFLIYEDEKEDECKSESPNPFQSNHRLISMPNSFSKPNDMTPQVLRRQISSDTYLDDGAEEEIFEMDL